MKFEMCVELNMLPVCPFRGKGIHHDATNMRDTDRCHIVVQALTGCRCCTGNTPSQVSRIGGRQTDEGRMGEIARCTLGQVIQRESASLKTR